MTGFVRSECLVVALAVLDEVLVAAPNWASAALLMRERGYRHVPKQPGRMKPGPDAVALAVRTPGVVYRRKWATGDEWQSVAAEGEEGESAER
jgi:hypothetical protein